MKNHFEPWVLLVVSPLFLLASLAPAADDAPDDQLVFPPQPVLSLAIDLETIATGLSAPDGLVVANDGTNRLFVLEQTGKIRIIDTTDIPQLFPAPFLDLTASLVPLRPGFDERGVIGLAFHPGYRTNQRFYVLYSAPRPNPPPSDGSPNYFPTRTTLSEFQTSADPNLADAASERILLTIDKIQFNHNGGQLAFGPDGFLYIGIGDGGGANDVGAEHNPTTGNGQDPTTLKGKILRIDVNATSGALPYAIPPGNPFESGGGRAEIFALGMRNPFRFGFDDYGVGSRGRFILPDVGQNLVEEINLVSGPGQNFGWRVREGTICFDPLNPNTPLGSCDTTGLTDPVAEYHHPASGDLVSGLAVIGGYVYRGASQPAMRGVYVFGDFSKGFAGNDGQILAMAFDTAFPTNPPIPISRVFIGTNESYSLRGVLNAVGRDERGELYVIGQAGIGFPNPPTGFVKKIINAREFSLGAAGWKNYE